MILSNKLIAAELRDTIQRLRRTSMPLANVIPLLQRAADALDWQPIAVVADISDKLKALRQILVAIEQQDRWEYFKSYGWAGARLYALKEDLEAAQTSAPAPPPSDQNGDHEDAERWRALIGCARIRVLTGAGLLNQLSDGHAHIGLELWTTHEMPSDQRSIDLLQKFAEIAVRTRRT